MKPILTVIAIVVVIIGGIFGFRSYEPTTMFFNKSGKITKQIRIFSDTFAISSATQTFDISAAGFTTVACVQIQPESNTGSASSVPLGSIKTWTNTSVTCNFVQSNSQTISILGVNVLGLQFLQSFTGLRVHLIAAGY